MLLTTTIIVLIVGRRGRRRLGRRLVLLLLRLRLLLLRLLRLLLLLLLLYDYYDYYDYYSYYYYNNYYYYYDKFFLVGWSQLQCFYQVPRGKKFSFGWGPGLGSIALACHGFASAGAVTLGSALSPLLPPLGMFPVDTPMTIPWPSQEWLHHHSQSHGALSHSNPQPNAVGPQQYVWMCEKKKTQAEKFFSTRLKNATAARQPENFSASEQFFSDHSPLKR